MFQKIFKAIFGSRNERVLKGLNKVVRQINGYEPTFEQLSDEALGGKTQEFKQRLAKGETLNSILPEAFACVREVSKRTLGLRHFDVQLVGGMVLNQGNIAEMLTGEGKTLVATLPAYLNALSGRGVHIITVNDYLVKRDAKWMEPVYSMLGMTVGVNVAGMSHQEKQQAYRADITFGTNNEFGFDFLRDNMAFRLDDRVQRDLGYAIVDEVDSILIDEARTPLIISGPSEDSSERYVQINQLIPQLACREGEEGPGDYYLDEKSKQAFLTEDGHRVVEEKLSELGLLQEGESLYDASHISLMHHIYAALRAHGLFQKDVDYIVKNDQIMIVDEHTGRLMEGRRWSDGLHQAVEAKEGVTIQTENQTLASITFQNYFRSYDKLAGMTGTADTEAYEFHQIYGLEVIVILPNQSVARKDQPDQIYLSTKEKFAAITDELKACQKKKQPVLVGTVSIEVSEYLSNLLKKEGIKHEILNAKQHAREAIIIAQAGRPGAVTIATNMAGRGTDIVLGGNLEAELAELETDDEALIEKTKANWKIVHEQVVAAGGLHVVGTERHESRRIDNQLRGRSGRQGDPGSSRFYLSLDDSLLRIFAGEKLYNLMQKLGVPEGEALESKMLTRVIENAQRKVEGHNFDIRKQLLEYDNVANEQRKVIYAQRTELMGEDDVSETIHAMLEHVVEAIISEYIPPQSFVEQWDVAGLEKQLQHDFSLALPVTQWVKEDEKIQAEEVVKRISQAVNDLYQNVQQQTDTDSMRNIEKTILLQLLDHHWKDHLAAMDHLRQGIHLRGYAQKNPKQEYKRESFELFAAMLEALKKDVVLSLCRLKIQSQEALEEAEAERRQAEQQASLRYIHEQQGALDDAPKEVPQEAAKEVPFKRETPKVGRNEKCPCGSGKKYKHCHGSLVEH